MRERPITQQEYLLALEQAQEELDPALSSKRLLAELGMTGEADIAKPLGNGLWRLHGSASGAL